MSQDRPPRWSSKKDVTAFVGAKIAEAEAEEQRLFQAEFGFTMPGMTRKGFLDEVEKDGPEEQWAVADALRGDLKALARLVRPINLPEFGVSNEINPAIERLSPETWNLIAQFLAGERNLRTGRMKGEPGRPKMSIEERRKQTRTYTAADEFPVIRLILRRFYPEQKLKDISDRAEDIAKARARIATSVRNLRWRSRKTGHKI